MWRFAKRRRRESAGRGPRSPPQSPPPRSAAPSKRAVRVSSRSTQPSREMTVQAVTACSSRHSLPLLPVVLALECLNDVGPKPIPTLPPCKRLPSGCVDQRVETVDYARACSVLEWLQSTRVRQAMRLAGRGGASPVLWASPDRCPSATSARADSGTARGREEGSLPSSWQRRAARARAPEAHRGPLAGEACFSPESSCHCSA